MKYVTKVAILSGILGVSACNLNGYQVGGTVTGVRGSGLVLEDNSGNQLTITGSGTFTFSSRVKNNKAYSVTVATQPTRPAQTCTVHNGSGTINRAAVTNVIVTCVEAGRFAYVANQGANDISAFAIDSTSGSLAPVTGSPFASTGKQPVAVTVDPNGTHLYAANNTSSNVSVYAINDTTGVLTSTGAIATGNGPSAVVIEPTNRFLYVANLNDDTVSAFLINASTGLGTAVTGSPFAAGAEPLALKVDPSGNFLYVVDFTGAAVTVFSIDDKTGALKSIAGSPFGAGAGADSIALTPAGTYAYVANETAATLSMYSIDSATGALTPVSGSPLPTTSSPESVAVDPSGRFVFAANVTAKNRIATYVFAPTSGALSLGTTAASGVFPLAVVVDPVSELVYAANDNSGTVSVYALTSSSGVLTEVSGSPFLAGSGARSIAID